MIDMIDLMANIKYGIRKGMEWKDNTTPERVQINSTSLLLIVS